MGRVARRSIDLDHLESALVTPQSGQVQVSGMSSQRVPGSIPSSGKPSASLYRKPQTTHIQVRRVVGLASLIG